MTIVEVSWIAATGIMAIPRLRGNSQEKTSVVGPRLRK